MKASELVRKIQDQIDKYGDLEVFLAGDLGWDEFISVSTETVDMEDVPFNAGETFERWTAEETPRSKALEDGSRFIGIT